MAKRMRQYGGPGHAERRGDAYFIRFMVAGRMHRFTVKSLDLDLVEETARHRHIDAKRDAERAAAGLCGVPLFSRLIEEFKSDAEYFGDLARGTQEAYADSFKPLLDYFSEHCGDPRVDEIKRRDVKAYRVWRKGVRYKGNQKNVPSTVSPRTLRKDLAVLHRLFEFAEDQEYVEANPAHDRKRKRGQIEKFEPVILTDAEYEKLLDACNNDRLRFYLTLLAETGLRAVSEALKGLRWDDVDLAGGFIHVVNGRDGHNTKTHRSRYVPMTPRLLSAAKEYFARYRFTSESPLVFGGVARLERSFKAAGKRAGIRPCRLHDLRHRRVTTWLAEGRDLVKVQAAVGHSSVATTQRYTHLVKEHLASLVTEKPFADADKQAVAATQ